MGQPVNLSRRNLLRGKITARTLPLRPPGAINEALFLDICTTCNDCVAACPQGIIFRGAGSYPEVDFRQGECTFCARCIDVCAVNALEQHTDTPPWRLQLVLGDHCLAQRQVVCETCADSCEAEAIHFRPTPGSIAVPSINQDLCTGCGACIAACPEYALQAVAHA